MAILLTGTGGLFTRLGKLGKILFVVNGHQSDLDTALTNVAAQYAATLLNRYGVLANAQTGLVRAQSGVIGAVRQLAQNTILDMVAADQPAASRTLSDAIAEVRRQMIASANSVQVCTVGVTIAALGTPTGTGIVLTSTKRGDGLVQENQFAEVGRVVCLSDSYTGGQTVGRESFRYVGESDLGASAFDYDWPDGSAASTALTAISADQNASTSGNLLTNGNFETWSGTPATVNGNAWVTTGVAGTDFAQDTGTPFRGASDFEFLAGTGANTALVQTFNSGSGTTATLKPLQAYAVNLWARRAGAVTAGVLTVDLIDGSNTVIDDQQGTPNSFTATLSALTTSYAPVSGVFRLPAVMPATVSVRLRLSTPLTGANVLIDDVCMTPMTPAYTGGPQLAVFSGAIPFVQGDTWTATATNDRGGSTDLATFQALWDRFFGMRGLGLLLPSSGSPTIADTLITA